MGSRRVSTVACRPTSTEGKLRTPTELKTVEPGMECVVANGLWAAAVPSATYQATSALRLSRHRGAPSSDRSNAAQFPNVSPAPVIAGSALSDRRRTNCAAFLRSEEHTSELQSRGHLVCR